MEARRRLSSESSSYSCSSGTSYYGCGSSLISDDEEISGSRCSSVGRSISKSRRTFFDDVKVILSRHDSKLSKMEDDLSCVVRWLNEKFDFILRYESASSIPSMWGEEQEHTNMTTNSDDPMMTDGPHSKGRHTPFPPSSITPVETENFPDEYDNETQDSTEMNYLHERQRGHHTASIYDDDESSQLSPGTIDDSVSEKTSLKQVPTTDIAHRNFSPTPSENIIARTNSPEQSLVKKSNPPTETPEEIITTRDSPRPSQCDTCGKFLKDPSSLRQHKKIHLNIRPFICTETDCGKSFRRKFHLQTHALIHKGVKDHQCGYCGRCFLLQKDLITHERIHTGERPFNCPECPKSFTLKSHLVMHVRTHTGEKPYKCDVCNKAFTQSNTLRLHKKKVHQEKSESIPKAKNAAQSSKKSTGSRKKKGTKKDKDKETSPGLTAGLPLPTPPAPPMPAKLPIYRNQLTAFKNIPSTSHIRAPTLTILQQPVIANHAIELLEPLDTTTYITSNDKIVLTESTLNMLSAVPSTSGISTLGNSVPLISSEILSIPQHLLIPRSNNL